MPSLILSSNESIRAMMARLCLYRLVIRLSLTALQSYNFADYMFGNIRFASAHTVLPIGTDCTVLFGVWGLYFAATVPKHVRFRLLIFHWQIALQGVGGVNKQ